MFATGFQSFAFQSAGYGISTLSPNGNSDRLREYTPTYYELENTRQKLKKFKDAEKEVELGLASIQYKIEELEFERLRDLADEKMQLQLISLLKEQQIMQQILKELIIQKERARREEDDLMMLLMSLPFFA